MVRSRLQERREESHRKNVRTAIIIVVVVLLLLIVLIHRWYVSVYSPYWNDRSVAVTEAVYAGNLAEVIGAEAFNGEQPWFIVNGIDQEGDETIVWVSEEQSIAKRVEEGISAEEAQRIVLAKHGQASIIRATPGVWLDELCYEIYYKVSSPGGDIYYYDYIRFEDGEWIETLRLGK